jgi:hypothetical protein
MEMQNAKLNEQINHLKGFLLSKGYSTQTILNYALYWDKLESYALEKGHDSFTVELGSSFLFNEYGIDDAERPPAKMNNQARAINLLRHFIFTKSIAPFQQRCSALPKQFTDINNRYMDFLLRSGQQFKSIKAKKSRLRQFMAYLSDENIVVIEFITKTDLLRFMSYLKDRYSTVGRGNILYTVKDFLLFCATENIIDESIPSIIKGIYTNPNEKLPSVY